MTRVRPETVIEDEVVTVEPGQMAQTTLTVRNTGNQIAEYGVSMVPDCVAAGWAQAEPPTFRLMPGKDQRVLLRFHPPLDSSTPAGSFPYGVVVRPNEEHQAPAVAEGDIAIGAFHAVAAELKPTQSRGRWRGRHVVKLHNQGTDDVRVKLSPPADDEGLSYALAPTTLAIPPRAKAEAFLKVRPRTMKMMGKPADHAFEVTYRRRGDSRAAVVVPGGGVPEGGEVDAQLQGSFTQKPLVSKTLLMVLGLLAVGAVLLAVLRPWEGPQPKVPPEPLESVQMISTDDAIVASWDSPPNIDEVQIREVDCETAGDVIPAEVAVRDPIEISGAGTRHETLDGFAPGEMHCMQVRAMAGGNASIWTPTPAFSVDVGNTVAPPAKVDPVHVGACKVDVDWTLVEPESDAVLYQVILNGQPLGAPVTAGPVTSDELPPGQPAEVTVQTIVQGFEPEGSEDPATVDVPEDCEEQAEVPGDVARAEEAAEGAGDEEGPGDGAPTTTPGGTTGTEAGQVDLSGRFWLLIPQGEQRLEGDPFRIWRTMWPVYGLHLGLWTTPAGIDAETREDMVEFDDVLAELKQPRYAVVGVDVILPRSMMQVRGTQPGDEIFYVDLDYGDDRRAAEKDCADLNAFLEFERLEVAGLPCFLVTPTGQAVRVEASDIDVEGIITGAR